MPSPVADAAADTDQFDIGMEYATSTLACSMLRVERKLAGDTARTFTSSSQTSTDADQVLFSNADFYELVTVFFGIRPRAPEPRSHCKGQRYLYLPWLPHRGILRLLSMALLIMLPSFVEFFHSCCNLIGCGDFVMPAGLIFHEGYAAALGRVSDDRRFPFV